MRRRLTISIVAVVVGTLVLTTSGGLLLIQRASLSTAENSLNSEAVVLARGVTVLSASGTDPSVTFPETVKIVDDVSSYRTLYVVGVTADKGLSSIGGYRLGHKLSLSPALVRPGALLAGSTVSGNVGRLVFSVVPLNLSYTGLATVGIPYGERPVLLVSRIAPKTASGIGYFILVAPVAVVVAALVAAALARRFGRPLQRIAAATTLMARGDLSAQVSLDKGDDADVVAVAEALHGLGAELLRSQQLERQFLLSVSHELRTPLTSIRGYAEAITEGFATDDKAAAQVIGVESARLDRLVRDLLDLARLDTRRFSLNIVSVDPQVVVEQTAEGFIHQSSELGLELTVHTEGGGSAVIRADPDRLAQIAANLIENALKFAATRVEVELKTGATGMELLVVDDGPGISQADLPRVFDRHFQGDTVSGRHIGTGIGLAIVTELAGAMGMTVRAESPAKEGRGTRMVLTLDRRS